MPSFTYTEFKAEVEAQIKGDLTSANMRVLLNKSVREVVSKVDLRSTIRKSALTPNLFDDIFQYTCPTDLKGNAVIDVKPQSGNRSRTDIWRLVSQEEFDRYKQDLRLDKWGDPITLNRSSWQGENLISFQEDDMVRKLLISKVVDDDSSTISTLDSLTAGGGTWEAFGDGTNLTKDSDNYIKGSASINWDIDDSGGTTAGIYNDDLDEFDITDYKTTGSVFVWAYISSATDLTNFILRIGSDASNYYSITITTNNEGNSFEDGWNLLRFDFVNKSTTGTPDDDACKYVALYMTKDAGKTDETDYRFDHIILKRGKHHDLIYYSKYGWQNNSGTWIEDSTADTDVLNADTDEYQLFIARGIYNVSKFLPEYNDVTLALNDYKEAEEKYKLENPSQRLTLIQKYYDL